MLNGPSDHFFLEFRPDDVLKQLYQENANLKAEVQTLFQLVAYLFEERGVRATRLQTLIDELYNDNYADNLVENPLMDTVWKEIIKNGLGDMPGVKL